MAPPHTEPRRWACHKCHHRTRTQNSSYCRRCQHHCCTECRMTWRMGFDNGKRAWYKGDITDRHFHRSKIAIVRNLDPRGPSRCSEYTFFDLLLYNDSKRGIWRIFSACCTSIANTIEPSPSRRSFGASPSFVHRRCYTHDGSGLAPDNSTLLSQSLGSRNV